MAQLNTDGTMNGNSAGDTSNGGRHQTDWRLPNVRELHSLVDYGRSPCFPSEHPFNVGNGAQYYWSSTTVAHDPDCAWRVRAGMGRVESHVNKTKGKLNVWPVRGGTRGDATVPKTGQTTSFAKGDDGDLRVGVAWPNPRLTDNNDGTVTDNLTGLIWLKKADMHSTDWATALKDVAQLNTDGTMNGNSAGDTSNGGRHQIDWRLPNVRELSSLLDYGQPSVLPSGHPFSGYKPRYYWSSTTVPRGITPLAFSDRKEATTHAYKVNPSDRVVFYAPKTDSFPVWPVRGPCRVSAAQAADKLPNEVKENMPSTNPRRTQP